MSTNPYAPPRTISPPDISYWEPHRRAAGAVVAKPWPLVAFGLAWAVATQLMISLVPPDPVSILMFRLPTSIALDVLLVPFLLIWAAEALTGHRMVRRQVLGRIVPFVLWVSLGVTLGLVLLVPGLLVALLVPHRTDVLARIEGRQPVHPDARRLKAILPPMLLVGIAGQLSVFIWDLPGAFSVAAHLVLGLLMGAVVVLYVAASQVYPAVSSPTTPQLFRVGDMVAFTEGADLPDQCLACDQDADVFLKKRLYWHAPLVYLLLLLNPLIYVFVAMMVRRRMAATLPLCGVHSQRRHLGWVVMLGAGGMAAITMTLGTALHSNVVTWLGAALMPTALLVGAIVHVAMQPWVVKRIDDHGVHLSKVHPAFLDRLQPAPAALG